MDMWKVVQDAVLLFGAAMVLGAVFERLRMSAILGYLLAGALLGHGVFNVLSNEAAVKNMAEIGVALLLFSVGLEFSFRRLLAMGRVALGGGVLQILVTALVFAGVGMAFGLKPNAALALGLLAAPSSTASVIRLLGDRTELDSVHGRYSVGILLLQDLALVPMVVAIAALGAGGSLEGVVVELVLAAVFFSLLALGFWLTSVYVLPRALWNAALLKNREILILLAVFMAMGSMWAAHGLGVSPALGAFIAGMLIAESPFANQIRTDVGTVRVLFVTLFFASVGIVADLSWAREHWGLVLGSVGLVVVVKMLVVWGVLRVLGIKAGTALATGACLAQVGEFSFVLAAIGLDNQTITQEMYLLIVSVCIGSLVLTPLLVAAAPRLGRLFERVSGQKALVDWSGEDGAPHLRDHVVVIGYGPAGRGVVAALQSIDAVFLILELNPLTVREAKAVGLHAQLGDATHEDVINHACVRSARAVVVTLPDHRTALAVVAALHGSAPEVPIIVRARYHIYASAFTQAGATFVVDEEMQVGQFLGECISRGLMKQQAG